ncbi:inositol monophosphatase family protein [Bartonella sp. TT110JLCBS]|uniref:inositol monophosphatase family protein n=1 Tax=Bartonella sp. TT110JLCBS TaxID=3243578 RepID=UPI0035D09C10
MEESEEIIGEDSQHRFIIDPLRWHHKFSPWHSFFAVSIALESQGKVVGGVIYNPVNDELFTAERGCGAFFNDRRCRVSAQHRLEDCVIATGNASFWSSKSWNLSY